MIFICVRCDQERDTIDGSEMQLDPVHSDGLICQQCLDEEAYHHSDSPASEYERVERMRAEMKRKMEQQR